MAASLSTQLEGLRRERERLEELLMLDANWRALRQLEEREAAGQPLSAVDGAGLKASLEKALAANRIYVARAKLLETIDLLSADFPVRSPGADNGPLSSRIVMLSEPEGDTFRARLRLKPEPARPKKLDAKVPEAATGKAASEAPGLASLSNRLKGEIAAPVAVPAPVPESVPESVQEPASFHVPATVRGGADPLQLIDGLSRHAVEMLIDGGVTTFRQIADWSSVDVAMWRARLDGATQGSAGWWIEQAALLASGRATHFADRARRGEFAILVPPPQPEPPRPWTAAAVASDASDSQIVLADTREAHTATVAVVVPPVLPECAVAARGVTAEELARALDQSEVLPPPLPAVAVELVAVGGGHVVSTAGSGRPDQAGPGYLRPRQAPSGGEVAAAEADVVVAQAPVVAPPPAARVGERPRTLLKRIKALQQSGRFESDDYAAYRGSVEEASVTILAPVEAKPEPGPLAKSVEGGAARAPNRFLKALTGKA